MKALAAVMLALVLLALPAAAQETYPNRPITLVVPFAPGGSTDVIGRIVAEGMRPAGTCLDRPPRSVQASDRA